MTKYSTALIAILFPQLLSCGSDKTGSEESANSDQSETMAQNPQSSWKPSLGDGEKLLRVVSLEPGDVIPIEGLITFSGMYGIAVKEAWDLKDKMDQDQKNYMVLLRSTSPEPNQTFSVGTTYSAATNFNHGESVRYELENQTPLSVTVAIYSAN